MQKKYGFFWLAKIFGCEPNGSAKKIPSATLVIHKILEQAKSIEISS